MQDMSFLKNKTRKGSILLINKTIETPQGTVKFEGELEAQELDLVLQIGLNYLLQQGALPFTFADEVGDVDENTH
jgi:ABC-type proline/glycine betaine transport system ATPase subunit